MDSWNSNASYDFCVFSDHIHGIVHADASGEFKYSVLCKSYLISLSCIGNSWKQSADITGSNFSSVNVGVFELLKRFSVGCFWMKTSITLFRKKLNK